MYNQFKDVIILVSFRNKLGAIVAFIGGILLVIAGGVGMAPLLTDIKEVVEERTDNEDVINILKILIYLAALGGISVILGGILMYLDFPLAAKILIMLGAGIGIIGLLIGFLTAWWGGQAGEYFNSLTSTIGGLGALLSIVAYYLAK